MIDFFTLPVPELARETINLPTFGEVTLERLDTVKQLLLSDLVKAKLEQYKLVPFVIGDKDIPVTETLATTCAAIQVMQVQDKKYPFEQLLAAAIVKEDEFNMLTILANKLNSAEEEAPKQSAP